MDPETTVVATGVFATYGPWVGPLVVAILGTLLGWVTLRTKHRADAGRTSRVSRSKR